MEGDQLHVPFISKDIISESAERLIREYIGLVGEHQVVNKGLSFEDVYSRVIFPRFGIELQDGVELGVSTDGKKLLGLFDIKSNVALIDSSIGPTSGDPRRTFTLWHEVGGHGVLQGQFLRRQLNSGRGFATVEVTASTISESARHRLEVQANVFAAAAAAPVFLVRAQMVRLMRLTRPLWYSRPSYYSLDAGGRRVRWWIGSHEELCRAVAAILHPYFDDLSVEALGYAVSASGLVTQQEPTGPKWHRLDGSRGDHANVLQRVA